MNNKCEFFSECLAISEKFISFRVELYYEGRCVGKASAVVHRSLEVISFEIVGNGVQRDESCIKAIKESCVDEAKLIWAWNGQGTIKRGT